MRAELAALSRILAVVNRAALWISGIGLVVMTAFVAWQVFGRYVLNQSPSWTEPASLLLMSWFILLGSAVGVRDGNHLGFEIALHYAPHGLRHIMLAVTEVLVAIFGGAMAWYGTALAVETWTAAMPGLPIPQGFDYVPLAVGGVLIALFSLEKLVRLLLVGDDAPMVRVDEPHLVAVKD
ncbi:TRAP transporter small permease [Microvirga sp. 3-52]|uniref:TRAP transporter small permease n=1 Tax=Microvirga sp. 3-52 TaxID=2792425 RepID=UPI001AD491AA|nr:TRAP transporter small permease [Microvirga sp. 3-52]MBO1903374.1 TRAP transporter small permease [Microvirga sp. 3-52]MBS7451027.1 TRAP transporter small permease [Microvirga sp. 3-52]